MGPDSLLFQQAEAWPRSELLLINIQARIFLGTGNLGTIFRQDFKYM